MSAIGLARVRRIPRCGMALAAGAMAWSAGAAFAQGIGAPSPSLAAPVTPAVAAATLAQTGNSVGERFFESCRQLGRGGGPKPGCQGPLYMGEMERLKEEALRTNNAQLFTLLGDAYRSNRSGISDIGQAYRWYVLAAVRGDPRAMQRLAELYQTDRNAPDDRIRALGYARLTQRLAAPGSRTATQAAAAARKLGRTMAIEDIAVADSFADELEAGIGRASAGAATPGLAGPNARSDATAPASPPIAVRAYAPTGVPGLAALEARTGPVPTAAPAAPQYFPGAPGETAASPAALPPTSP